MWAQIGTLIMATSLIQLANGFFGTFISLRVAIEDFGATMSGLVLSSYFAGFTLGALRCERIIERVGHIRAYAAFAGPRRAGGSLLPEGHRHRPQPGVPPARTARRDRPRATMRNTGSTNDPRALLEPILAQIEGGKTTRDVRNARALLVEIG
jgi:hypothetical protein